MAAGCCGRCAAAAAGVGLHVIRLLVFITIAQCGFIAAGDVGYYDSDRFVYIVGRIKELIKYKSFQASLRC